MTYNEMELRGAVSFLNSVMSHLWREFYREWTGLAALREVTYAHALVACDLAFYETEHPQ